MGAFRVFLMKRLPLPYFWIVLNCDEPPPTESAVPERVMSPTVLNQSCREAVVFWMPPVIVRLPAAEPMTVSFVIVIAPL